MSAHPKKECPELGCDNLCGVASQRCVSCSNRIKNTANALPQNVCVDCQEPISAGAERCRPHSAAYRAWSSAQTPKQKNAAVSSALKDYEISMRPVPQVAMTAGCRVYRQGEPSCLQWNSDNAEALREVSAETGFPVVKVKLKGAQIKNADADEYNYEDTARNKATLYRVEAPLSWYLPWSVEQLPQVREDVA